MTKFTHLNNAPIIEALIDIRTKIRDDVKVNQLESIYALIADQYPDKKTLHKFEGKIEFKKDEKPVSLKTEIDGCIFTSADQKQIFQARLDGFTFSRLKPYETWEQLRDEAKKLWQIYNKVTSPEITRVALRYINKMEFPLNGKDFSEYLTAAPIIPEGLPQGLNSFLTRVVMHEPSIDAAAIITQALEQVVNPNIIPVILDIDVFKQKSEGINEGDAWDILEKLRVFKNQIFDKSTTEKAKEIFK